MAAAKAAILGVEPRAEVILFGSRARGEAHAESDFDLLAVTPEQVRQKDKGMYYYPIMESEMEHQELLCMHFISRERWGGRSNHPFLRVIAREGVRL